MGVQTEKQSESIRNNGWPCRTVTPEIMSRTAVEVGGQDITAVPAGSGEA